MRVALAVSVAFLALSGCTEGGSDRGREAPDAGGDLPDAMELPGVCPDGISPGDSCSLDPAVRCAIVNEFSSCTSTVCRCLGGSFSCLEGLGAQDGEPCADSPLTSCAYEGTPSCDVPPTAAGCSCDSDGTWRCFCACYGPNTACPIETDASGCPLRYDPALEGALCDPAISDCSFPEGTCHCVDDGSGLGAFDCTPRAQTSIDSSSA